MKHVVCVLSLSLLLALPSCQQDSEIAPDSLTNTTILTNTASTIAPNRPCRYNATLKQYVCPQPR